MISSIGNKYTLPAVDSSLAVLWRRTHFQCLPTACTKPMPSPCTPDQAAANALAPRRHHFLNTIAPLICSEYHFVHGASPDWQHSGTSLLTGQSHAFQTIRTLAQPSSSAAYHSFPAHSHCSPTASTACPAHPAFCALSLQPSLLFSQNASVCLPPSLSTT